MTPILEDPPIQQLDHERIAPSQGGWVEFTLDQEGSYPFVTHAFGDMVKGAVGVLATENAPAAGMEH